MVSTKKSFTKEYLSHGKHYDICLWWYKWQNGVSMPTLDNLIVLAAIFNVAIDDIIVVDNKSIMQIGAWNKADSD